MDIPKIPTPGETTTNAPVSINFVPQGDDILRMVRAFVSVHEENVKDDIGPNKPDAPFFERVASMEKIDWEACVEMADRFKKYTRTQLPHIQHLAGYPPETNWELALDALRKRGERAKSDMKIAKSYLSTMVNAATFDKVNVDVEVYASDIENNTAFTLDESFDIAQAWVGDIKQLFEGRQQARTIQCERFTRVWYGKNDYNMRWPKEVPSIKISVPVKDKQLYDILKNAIGWPDFCWESAPHYRMSIKDEKSVIEKAAQVLDEVGYHVHNLSALEFNAPVANTQKQSQDFNARLVKDGVWFYIPFSETSTRVAVKDSGAKWQNASKEWSLGMNKVSIFVQKLEQMRADHPLIAMVNAIPQVEAYLQSKAERVAISGAAILTDDERITEMQTRLAESFNPGLELFPFQYVGVRFAELATGRCIIGDDMGIGKTIQALAYAALHPECWPVLVVAPASVKYNWANEIQKWLKDADYQVIHKGSTPVGDHDFTVINYDLVSKKQEQLLARNYNLVIFDESHYLKNEKAKRTVCCMEIADEADSVLCLSGTPITNRPKEFFTTLEMIRPSEWKGKRWDFLKRYCDAHRNEWGYWDTDGASNVEELHGECRDFMIRRLKKEVMAELPDKLRQFHTVQPTDAEMKTYNECKNTWVETYASLRARNSVPAGFLLNMLTDLRKKCGEIKIASAVEWVMNYLAHNDKPLVMFTHHLDIMDGIVSQLKELLPAQNIETIHGGVDAQKRTDTIAKFQAGELEVLVCSTTAVKEGVTLTAADTVVFVEREWVPAYEEQAEDRVNRIGQDNDTVWAVYLTVDNTIDIKFKNLIESKREVISSIVDGGEIGQRNEVVKDLLQAMVDSGEIPASMMESFNKENKGAKKYV